MDPIIFKSFLRLAKERKILIVTCAGNTGSLPTLLNSKLYPDVLVVGGLDKERNVATPYKADYLFGPSIELLKNSPKADDKEVNSSFATCVVTALACLIKSSDSKISNLEIINLIAQVPTVQLTNNPNHYRYISTTHLLVPLATIT